MTNEIKTGAKLGTKVGEAVVYVVFKFGSFAYCGVDLYEGLTMEECVALRGNGDIESYCEKTGTEWHNVECSVDAVRGKLLDLRTKAEQTEAVQEEMEEATEAHRTERALAVLGRVVDRIDYDRKGRRSAWGEGVQRYERELVADLVGAVRGGWVGMDDLEAPKLLERSMLNGASDWRQYSWGGCSLIYDGDIARRLCNPSELKRTKNGERRPNSSEEWLDTQARALYQAAEIVKRYVAVEVSFEVA